MMTKILVFFLLWVGVSEAARLVSVAGTTSAIEMWGTGTPGGQTLYLTYRVRIDNTGDQPQTIDITMGKETIFSDATATILYGVLAPARVNVTQTIANLQPGETGQVTFHASCGYSGNLPTGCLYGEGNFFNRSTIQNAGNTFATLSGRFSYVATAKISVREDAGAVVGSIYNSIHVTNWGDPARNPVSQQVLDGRPF